MLVCFFVMTDDFVHNQGQFHKRGLCYSGPLCRVSNLRNEHVPCHLNCPHLMSPLRNVDASCQFQEMYHVMSLCFLVMSLRLMLHVDLKK